jgi:hypothetical protein
MKSIPLLVIFVAAMSGFARPTLGADSTPLQQPVLKFEVLNISHGGIVSSVVGVVEVLVEEDGWVSLEVGTNVGEGTRLRVDPEATFTLAFASAGNLELKPTSTERWFVLETGVP